MSRLKAKKGKVQVNRWRKVVSGTGDVGKLVMNCGDNPDSLSQKCWADDVAIVITLGCNDAEGHCCYGSAKEVLVQSNHIDLSGPQHGWQVIQEVAPGYQHCDSLKMKIVLLLLVIDFHLSCLIISIAPAGHGVVGWTDGVKLELVAIAKNCHHCRTS